MKKNARRYSLLRRATREILESVGLFKKDSIGYKASLGARRVSTLELRLLKRFASGSARLQAGKTFSVR